MLPGLTVKEAAAGRPTLIATVVGVALGGLVVVPSLAILFGLVLRGRFDEEVTSAEVPPLRHPSPARRIPLFGLALALGAVGLPLVLVFDGGALLAVGIVALLAVGIVALLAFAALGSLAVVSALVSLGAADNNSGSDTARI